MFGQNKPPIFSAFGTQQATPTFGGTAAPAFGTPATSGPVFGGPSTSTGTGLFGSQQQTTAPLFGSPQPQTTPFGASPTSKQLLSPV